MNKKLLLSTIGSLLLLVVLQAQVPGYVPTTDLKAWWGFSGNGNDQSTNGNNLTNNGAVLTTDRYGVANSAYSFNGSTQYLTRTSPSFTFGATSSFTVSFWMQKSSNSYGVAIMNSSSTNGNFIWLFQTGTTGNFHFGTNKQGAAWVWAPTIHALNQWEHFVGTYNNGSMVLYKNGSQVATATYAHTGANQVNLPIWIGRGHNPNNFAGKLDDIGIWDRVLTLAEITALYAGCNLTVSNHPANASAKIGGTAKFGVDTVSSNASFQWQSKVGSAFQNLSNSGQFSGTTTDSLTVTNISMLNNGEMFRCVVTEGTTCSDTSNAADLTVCGEITLQPTDLTVGVNSTAQFATASNDTGATFQWQVDVGTTFVDLFSGGQYTGTTTDTLTLGSAMMSHNGKSYRCLVTSGSCTDTTDEVLLTVSNIGFSEWSKQNVIRVFPNPANDVLTIKVSNQYLNQPYQIVNELGQVLDSGKLETEEVMLNLNNFNQGFYLLKVKDSLVVPFTILR